MGDIAIRVENLSKQYRIGKREQYRTFRDTLTDALTAPFRRVGGLLRGNAYAAANLTETIWALKDVSFEVKKGEVIGIIGRNGAGKSTLLKILSRITEPTEGRALVYGRVGALLEVGTGFHPELTGRENIYLNGAILGMSREEIARKFDEIVAFAEVEQFIDTPVKHYSSGMGLRLGFAVAAHMEPEILIVDEVLAVGDAQFQKKCLGKMGEVAGEGRTVLFVSHNMAAVGHLCSRAMLLDSGSIVVNGPTDQTINRYLSVDNGDTGSHSLQDRRDRTGTGEVRLTAVALVDEQFTPLSGIQAGQPAIFAVSYESQTNEAVADLSVALRVEDSFGQYLFTLASLFTGQHFDLLPPKGMFTCKLPAIPLVEGQYNVYLSLYRGNTRLDAVEKAMQFVVHSSDAYGTGRFPYGKKHGTFFIAHSWEFQDEALERNPQ